MTANGIETTMASAVPMKAMKNVSKASSMISPGFRNSIGSIRSNRRRKSAYPSTSAVTDSPVRRMLHTTLTA
jgi:hypothetical protein